MRGLQQEKAARFGSRLRIWRAWRGTRGQDGNGGQLAQEGLSELGFRGHSVMGGRPLMQGREQNSIGGWGGTGFLVNHLGASRAEPCCAYSAIVVEGHEMLFPDFDPYRNLDAN